MLILNYKGKGIDYGLDWRVASRIRRAGAGAGAAAATQ